MQRDRARLSALLFFLPSYEFSLPHPPSLAREI